MKVNTEAFMHCTQIPILTYRYNLVITFGRNSRFPWLLRMMLSADLNYKHVL